MSILKKNSKGFTLIELVIVLAIAALILAGILLAVRGAQQSRRDTQRKDDAGKIGANIEQAASNYDGNYVGQAGGITLANFIARYTNPIRTPDGGTYAVSIAGAVGNCPAGAATANTVQIAISGRIWQVCMGLESQDWFRATSN